MVGGFTSEGTYLGPCNISSSIFLAGTKQGISHIPFCFDLCPWFRRSSLLLILLKCRAYQINQAFSPSHVACDCSSLMCNQSKKPMQDGNSSAPGIVLVYQFGLFSRFRDSNFIINYCFYSSLPSLTTCRFFVTFTLMNIIFYKQTLY